MPNWIIKILQNRPFPFHDDVPKTSAQFAGSFPQLTKMQKLILQSTTRIIWMCKHACTLVKLDFLSFSWRLRLFCDDGVLLLLLLYLFTSVWIPNACLQGNQCLHTWVSINIFTEWFPSLSSPSTNNHSEFFLLYLCHHINYKNFQLLLRSPSLMNPKLIVWKVCPACSY